MGVELNFSNLKTNRYPLVALIVIITAVASAYFLTMRPVEVVALGINYVQGEKMTYEIDTTMKMLGQEFSYKMTYSIEILTKEEEVYTVRTTFGLMNQTFSITARINETGHTVEFLDAPPEFQQTMSSFSFMPGNGFYFPQEEAKVGDSWQIPIDMQTEEFNLTGTINNRITETRRITVPAGTYEVFKLEITSSDFTLSYNPPPELNMTEPMEIHMTMKGYEYFEKGTCRVVEANFEQTTTMDIMGQTVSMTLTLNMRLMEHIK